MKFDLYALEWQQFEILSFRCLQEDISKGVQFIEGGSDKGRDIVFDGLTDFYEKPAQKSNSIFQVKHKSSETGYSALKNDLKKELEKIYVKNKFLFDHYVLVTNLPINGSQYDELLYIFSKFLKENKLNFLPKFNLYSYRNFESVIERNINIKWNFPYIIKNTDFQYIIDQVLNKRKKNIVDGWIEVFKNNKNKFIYTNMYEKALITVESENILLLSGPPKSGKTFNGEMIVLNKVCIDGFTPYKIDSIQDFENFYDKESKQIFLFDDVFGKYNLDLYKSDILDRKLEYIIRHVDRNHKCIFTSREYIYRAFTKYSDKDIEKNINKIVIEVSNLTIVEKESIFRRYFSITFPEETIIDTEIIKLVRHKNFSPESVRSYFQSANHFSLVKIQEHLRNPDEYLGKIFENVNEGIRIVLLAVLFSKDGAKQSIAYCYQNIVNDLNFKFLSSLNEKLLVLDGSIIRLAGNRYVFYHPSMNNFLLKYLANDLALYRNVLFKNINLDILNLSSFKSPTGRHKDIIINREDLENFEIGILRMIKNPFITINEINSLLSWLEEVNNQWGFKVTFNREYTNLISKIKLNLKYVFFEKVLKDNLYFTSELFIRLRRVLHLNITDDVLSENIFKSVIMCFKNETDYWRLVFSITPFLKESVIESFFTKVWLKNFISMLDAEINALGYELFGDDFPDFKNVKAYNDLLNKKEYDLASQISKGRFSDYLKITDKSWYIRYKSCKEKMATLKTSPMYGYKIYLQFSEKFDTLKKFETNQKSQFYSGKNYDENYETGFY